MSEVQLESLILIKTVAERVEIVFTSPVVNNFGAERN